MKIVVWGCLIAQMKRLDALITPQKWFKSYGHFTEGLDFAYWWSFSGVGCAPAACAAGLFVVKLATSSEENKNFYE